MNERKYWDGIEFTDLFFVIQIPQSQFYEPLSTFSVFEAFLNCVPCLDFTL